MKNALVYTVNGNKQYVDMVMNSINSFYEHNKKISKDVSTYIVCDVPINPTEINENIHYEIIKTPSYDYSKLQTHPRLTKYAFYKWEIFINPVFRDFDNLLYVDVDTEFVDDVYDLFTKNHDPGIYMSDNIRNWLKIHGGKYKNAKRYCNSGVIFLTPNKINGNILDELFNESAHAAIEENFPLADQCALNYVLNQEKYKGIWKNLDYHFNYCLGTSWDGAYSKSGSKILHYTGPDKDYELKYLKRYAPNKVKNDNGLKKTTRSDKFRMFQFG